MSTHLAEFVYASCGRDAGRCFIVVSESGGYLYLCNGKSRKVTAPKKKKHKHVIFTGQIDDLVLQKLSNGEQLTNKEARYAVRRYTEEI